MRAQPHSLLDAARVRPNGRDIGAFSFTRIAPEYPYAIWMPQPIFLAAILRKAAAFPSFRCWMGARVTSLLEEDGRVVGVGGLRHGQEPLEVRADCRVQRRLFFGAPLPPLDPAFSFRPPVTAIGPQA